MCVTVLLPPAIYTLHNFRDGGKATSARRKERAPISRERIGCPVGRVTMCLRLAILGLAVTLLVGHTCPSGGQQANRVVERRRVASPATAAAGSKLIPIDSSSRIALNRVCIIFTFRTAQGMSYPLYHKGKRALCHPTAILSSFIDPDVMIDEEKEAQNKRRNHC